MKTNVTYLIAANGAARREGNYVVVPVIAMVEGVVHAMNASAPEFVPASELSALGWEDRPIFIGHPMVAGYPVSGKHPAIAHTSIGHTKNPRVDGTRLLMEAWIDESKAEKDLIDRILAGEAIDVSQGAFVRTETTRGIFGGKEYFGVWRDIDPDHLALLPGARGACSWAMGCGIRAAMEHGTNEQLKNAWYDSKTGIDDHGRAADAHAAAGNAHSAAASAHQAALTGKGSVKIAHNASANAHAGTEHAAAMSQKTGMGTSSHNTSAKTESEHAAEHSTNDNHANAAAAHAQAASHHYDQAANHARMRMHAAEETDMTLHCYAEWLEAGLETDALIKTLRDIPQAVRDKMPKADFAGPNESFPIEQAVDVADAARAIGRAKGNRAEIKRAIVTIAYRKGFEASLPEDWKRKKDQKAASGLLRLIEVAKSYFKPAQDANQMGKNTLMDKLREAVMAVEPNGMVLDYHPVTDPAHVVYVCYDGMETTTWERAFTLADSGVVTLSDSKIEVEAVTTYEPVTGASPQRYLKAACSCQKEKEIDMTKTERIKALVAKGSKMFVEGDIKMLEGADDAQLARFEAAADADLKTATDAKVAKDAADKTAKDAADKVAKDASDAALLKAAQAGKASATFEELLATATPEVRAALKAAQDVVVATKAATIKTLKDSKRCTFTDVQLNAMDQTQLDSLVTLAGITVATSHGLQLPPAAQDGEMKVAAAPTNEAFNEAIRASVKK